MGISKGKKLVFQKKMTFARQRQEIIRKEAQDLLDAGVIKPIDFPGCLSNPTIVAKLKRAWRVCINFTDLNKAILKNPFPLPRIDQLVDSVAGNKFLSFLDTYKGYNLIPMEKEDIPKMLSSLMTVSIATHVCLSD